MAPSSSIIKTKLRPPVPGDDTIARSRLLVGLRRNPKRALTIVCAPAGSGKSTLVAQWLQEETRPVAWISLDAGESRLDAFLAYVLAALQGIYPNSCSDLQGLVQAVVPLNAEQVATLLINDMAELPSDFILVLEDYHVVRDPEVHRTLDSLLKHCPPQLHLVISTRTEPPLALNVLRAQGKVVEIRQGDLRFNRDEIRAFLSGSLGVTPSEEALTHVEQRTEGWATGLRLTALSVQAGDDFEVLAR